MKLNRFEEMIVWQKSKALNILLHKSFQKCRDFAFKDQIMRAALSIMNNIAEGFDRHSTKEYTQFIYISKGSCSEVKSMLYLALEFGYIDKDIFNESYEFTEEIGRLLHGLLRSLTTNH